MLILLFDIDGTLLLSGGAGRVAMQRSMTRLFGEYKEVDIPVHGRTDRAIIFDLLVAHDVDSSGAAIDHFYSDYLGELEVAMQECDGKLLPGILPMLKHLSEHAHVNSGILTGNGERAARIKLQHFGIKHFFGFGGYGENYSCRNQIAQSAIDAAGHHLDVVPNPDRTWVIGDTIHDVSCARSINARVIAVGTGNVDLEELQASQPDLYFDNLSDAQLLLQSIESFDTSTSA